MSNSRRHRKPREAGYYQGLASGKAPSIPQAGKPSSRANNRLSFFSKQIAKPTRNETMQLMKTLGIVNMRAEDYLSSSLDKPDLVYVDRVDLIDGYGLYAKQDIEAGVCIGMYTGDVCKIAEYDKDDNSYAMTVGGYIIDGIKKSNFTRFMNYSDTQDNVEFREAKFEGRTIAKVYTLRPIKAHQQILVDYNQDNRNEFLVMNVTDNADSVQNIYEKNKNKYFYRKMKSNNRYFDVAEHEELIVTKVLARILNGSQIPEDCKDEINLPALKLTADNKICSFKDAETFTPLMAACYLGQYDNVKWLVKHGAYVNQQQHHSGRSAIFFAMEGARLANTDNEKQNFYNIIQFLILENTNIFIYTIPSNRTVVQQAIYKLCAVSFEKLIHLLARCYPENFKHVIECVDGSDYDVFMDCILKKKFAKLKTLLEYAPSYFEDELKKSEDGAFIDRIRTCLSGYDNENKKDFIRVLTECEIDGENIWELVNRQQKYRKIRR